MSIPGSDILAEAFSCIDTVEVQHIAAGIRSKNAVGQYASNLAATPVAYQASVQAVDRKSYVELGLDRNRRYFNVYLSADVKDFKRDTTGDRILWAGRKLDVESISDWFELDGWVGLLCVEVDS